MERPAKRARVSSPNEPPHEELADWDLQAARARNDLNLKSIFEGIFAKYSKDFTEEGDEIDLQTGEIIVDHGHLLGMHEEGGSNEATEAWNYEAARQARKSADTDAEDQDVGDDEDSANLSEDDEDDLVASESDKEADICRPSDSAPPGPILDKPDATPVLPQDTFEQFNKIVAPIDPIWEAPELPVFSTPTAETRRVQVPPNLPNLRREPSPPGSGSLWAIPKRGRPFTEGKPRATPSKTRPRAKRKHHSSPVAYDWSFAAMTEDDDSDDPLQEEQPSPSVLKLKSWNIRGKTTNPPTLTCSPLARQPLPGPSKTKPPEPPQHQSTTDAAHNQEDKARHKSYLQSYVASARPYSLKSTTAPGTAGGSHGDYAHQVTAAFITR
ncbi:hypothetical protein N7470_001203 [Penicillium chermesinum]|nr:hypothetical protein N7470_001203 [Penicillium chermesinum]